MLCAGLATWTELAVFIPCQHIRRHAMPDHSRCHKSRHGTYASLGQLLDGPEDVFAIWHSDEGSRLASGDFADDLLPLSAGTQDNSSLSKAEYLICAGSSFLRKKQEGATPPTEKTAAAVLRRHGRRKHTPSTPAPGPAVGVPAKRQLPKRT
jgi:hypothetical protein